MTKTRLTLALHLVWAACAFAQPQVSLASFGAAGDGVSDDTLALQQAIDSSPEAATIDFGPASLRYRITASLVLRPNRTYTGHATIFFGDGAPAGLPLMLARYRQSDNIHLDGLTLDAGGIGAGLQLTVLGDNDVPGREISITGVTFRNTRSPAEPWHGAIYASVGLNSTRISKNRFVNCGSGIYVNSPEALEISDNEFDGITHGNAVTLIFESRPFTYGGGILISRNRGRGLKRMGIELFRSNGLGPSEPHIEGNVFENWADDAGHESFGISVVAGDRAVITGNRLLGGVGPLGIELGATRSTVQQNEVSGWEIGIVLQHNVAGSVISGNRLTDQRVTGISFSNAPGDKSNVRVESNVIRNPRYHGIFCLTEAWRGSSISRNTIARVAGKWSGDDRTTFYGIAPFPADEITITANEISQENPNPPAGFRFIPIRPVPRIVERDNHLRVR